MAKIPYQARNFPATMPLWSASTNQKPGNHIGSVSVTLAGLQAHAATIGDISILSGPSTRRLIDIQWRQACIESCLEVKNDYWVLTSHFSKLDSSEKTFMSYLLGMVQASVMAEHVLGAVGLVNVDEVLRLTGKLYKDERPDLIGFAPATIHTTPPHSFPAARILMEAKGASGNKRQSTVDQALNQVKPATNDGSNRNLNQLLGLLGKNALRVASVAYFSKHTSSSNQRVWQSYLEDPPSEIELDSRFTDNQFRGLIILAKLLPLKQAISELKTDQVLWPSNLGENLVAIGGDEKIIYGLPKQLAAILDKVPDLEQSRVSHSALRVWCDRISKAVPESALSVSKSGADRNNWEYAKLRSGLSLARRLTD